MKAWTLVIGFSTLGALFLAAVGRDIYERLTRRGDAALAERLIRHNAATFVSGCERVDWRKLNRTGERRWIEVLRAQRRSQKDDGRVSRFPSRLA